MPPTRVCSNSWADGPACAVGQRARRSCTTSPCWRPVQGIRRRFARTAGGCASSLTWTRRNWRLSSGTPSRRFHASLSGRQPSACCRARCKTVLHTEGQVGTRPASPVDDTLQRQANARGACLGSGAAASRPARRLRGASSPTIALMVPRVSSGEVQDGLAARGLSWRPGRGAKWQYVSIASRWGRAGRRTGTGAG